MQCTAMRLHKHPALQRPPSSSTGNLLSMQGAMLLVLTTNASYLAPRTLNSSRSMVWMTLAKLMPLAWASWTRHLCQQLPPGAVCTLAALASRDLRRPVEVVSSTPVRALTAWFIGTPCLLRNRKHKHADTHKGQLSRCSTLGCPYSSPAAAKPRSATASGRQQGA